MANGENAGLIFVFIFMFLLVVSGVSLLYVNKDRFLPKVESAENSLLGVEVNDSFVRFRALSKGVQVPVNYELYLNITKLKEGKVKKDAFELVGNLSRNDTFNIYMWDDDGRLSDFYLSNVSCFSNETCELDLKREAVINLSVEVFSDGGLIKIGAIDGEIREPLVIFSYSYPVRNLTLENRERVSIPKDKFLHFDRAFSIKTINGYSEEYFRFVKEQDFDSNITICVMDVGYVDKTETYLKSNDLTISDRCVEVKV